MPDVTQRDSSTFLQNLRVERSMQCHTCNNQKFRIGKKGLGLAKWQVMEKHRAWIVPQFKHLLARTPNSQHGTSCFPNLHKNCNGKIPRRGFTRGYLDSRVSASCLTSSPWGKKKLQEATAKADFVNFGEAARACSPRLQSFLRS